MASAWSWDADRVSVVFGVLDGSTGGFSVALGYSWPGPFPVWRQDKNPIEPARVKREEQDQQSMWCFYSVFKLCFLLNVPFSKLQSHSVCAHCEGDPMPFRSE